MKWMADDLSGKAACYPEQSTQLKFLSILMNFAMKRRKFQSQTYEQNDRLSAEKDHKVSLHIAKRIRRKCSRTKVRNIQRQLTMVSDIQGDRPIHIAVANEDLKLTQRLCLLMIRNSISVDIPNYLRQTPLHLAVMLGNTDIAELLLSFGASPLICDRNGNSVLHLAVKSNCTSVLSILLPNDQIKSIVNVLDHEGYSALHYAVLKGNGEAVKMLHSCEANMNKIDGKSGRSSLIHAVLEKNISMVDLLLNCGSCPQQADYSGRTALDMALETRNVQLINLLETWMSYSDSSSTKEQMKPWIAVGIKMRKRKTKY